MPVCFIVPPLKGETSTHTARMILIAGVGINKIRQTILVSINPEPGLPDNIIKLVKPIYARLSSEDLLKKCLDGKTQNQNESLNGMIWNRLPKSVFVGADVLEFGAYDAVAHFNIGSKAARKIFNELGLVPGQFFQNGVGQADKRWIMKAEHSKTPAVKKRKKVLRGQKKKREDSTKEKEGITYKAGAF